MPLENEALQEYSFNQSVFVRFPGRLDFTLAKYHKISLEEFSCFCNKTLKIGEVCQVEVNLKMITRGDIDDMEPHVATAELIGFSEVGGKQVCRFKFIDFKANCFDNLVKALVFLESKEKIVSLPVTSDIHVENRGDIDDIIKDIIKKTKEGRFVLPVLPKIVREVEVVVNQKDSTIEDLAMVIERDAAISVKVLSTANSPFYRGDTQIESIRETIPRLGFKETRNLVLTIANKSLYQVKHKLFRRLLENLWKHSLACAHCAKAIAAEKGFPNEDNFYTIGLVHDIGKTILFRFLSDMASRDNPLNEEGIVSGTERYNGEMCHIILRHWGFSGSFIKAIGMHHGNTIDNDSDRASLVIHAANMLARNMGYDIIDDLVDLSAIDSVKLLDMEPATLSKIGERVREMMEGSENAF